MTMGWDQLVTFTVGDETFEIRVRDYHLGVYDVGREAPDYVMGLNNPALWKIPEKCGWRLDFFLFKKEARPNDMEVTHAFLKALNLDEDKLEAKDFGHDHSKIMRGSKYFPEISRIESRAHPVATNAVIEKISVADDSSEKDLSPGDKHIEISGWCKVDHDGEEL